MDCVAQYNDLVSKRDLYKQMLKDKKQKLDKLNVNISAYSKAIDILTRTSNLVHKSIVEKVENIVTLAIRHVYDRDFEFKLIYEQKRNNIEARPVIMEGGDEYNIEEDEGGGLIDIISFALRIILWKLQNTTRNLFFLDEPFKWTGSYIDKAGEMLKYLSKELRFQVVLISHDDSLIDICDRVYRVSHNGTESRAVLVKTRQIKRR